MILRFYRLAILLWSMHLESRRKNHTFRIWIVHQHPTRNRKKHSIFQTEQCWENDPGYWGAGISKADGRGVGRGRKNCCSSRIRKPLLLLDRLLWARTDCYFDGTTLVLSGKTGAALLLDSWQRRLGKQSESSNPSTKQKQVWSWENRYYQGIGEKYVLA